MAEIEECHPDHVGNTAHAVSVCCGGNAVYDMQDANGYWFHPHQFGVGHFPMSNQSCEVHVDIAKGIQARVGGTQLDECPAHLPCHILHGASPD